MMCLEVVNLSDWERVGEREPGEEALLASEGMVSLGQTTYKLAPTNCTWK